MKKKNEIAYGTRPKFRNMIQNFYQKISILDMNR